MSFANSFNTVAPKTAEDMKFVSSLFIANWRVLFPQILTRSQRFQAVVWTAQPISPAYPGYLVTSFGQEAAMHEYQRMKQRPTNQQINIDLALDNSRLQLTYGGRHQRTAFHRDQAPQPSVDEMAPPSQHNAQNQHGMRWSAYEDLDTAYHVTYSEKTGIIDNPFHCDEGYIEDGLSRMALNKREREILGQDGAYAVVFDQVKTTVGILALLAGENQSST